MAAPLPLWKFSHSNQSSLKVGDGRLFLLDTSRLKQQEKTSLAWSLDGKVQMFRLFLKYFVILLFFYFFKEGNPASFCFFFSNKQYNLCNKSMWKMFKCPTSIWHWDSYKWPSENESSPITTRPRLPPYFDLQHR